MSALQHLVMPDGRTIALRYRAGAEPTVVFLPGYMSDMAGSKASAIWHWSERSARACLLFDYSGCGASGGDFAQGTLSRWHDEALALMTERVDGPIVLVGSSMGGWLMLLVAEALGDRVAGMIGIAAAPDFTRWGFTSDERAKLASGETVFADNPYGPEPTPTHPRFFADAELRLRLDTTIATDCPVRLFHGQRDTDVPFDVSLQLAAALRSDDIQVTLIKDGDHRLSRPRDIALLVRALNELVGD